eukprot:12653402-Alexandrium_andersonii.AAC.1
MADEHEAEVPAEEGEAAEGPPLSRGGGFLQRGAAAAAAPPVGAWGRRVCRLCWAYAPPEGAAG